MVSEQEGDALHQYSTGEAPMKSTYDLLFRYISLLVAALVCGSGCRTPDDPGVAAVNGLPVTRFVNTIVDDPAIDSTGNDGLWNAATDDLGSDGLPDDRETGCRGAFDPLTNPDPATDNYDPVEIDVCPPDSGNVKSDRSVYTQQNGRPDAGEPHVTPLRPLTSSLVRLDWFGNDPDGFVMAFMYRWNYKEHYSDSVYTFRSWSTVLNYVSPDASHLILMLDVAEGEIPGAVRVLYNYFRNNDRDPDRRYPGSPTYDSAYAMIFTRLAAGDTVDVQGYRVHASNPGAERFPVHETPWSGRFRLESNDLLNRHTFQVCAIDNEGATGPMTSVSFWTRKVEPPIVAIVVQASPRSTDTLFVLPSRTLTWPGIRFTASGADRNSQTISYSWKFDSREWTPFSDDVTVWCTGNDLDTPYTGRHTARLRGKNEFEAITPDSLQPTLPFQTVFPRFTAPGFTKRVLLVSVNRNPGGALVSRSCPPESTIMQYYDGIFSDLGIQHDLYSPAGIGHPALNLLSGYSAVYLITDNLPPGDIYKVIPAMRYARYAEAGGSMMINGIGWPSLSLVFSSAESLLVKVFRMKDLLPPGLSGTFEINNEFDCLGARAVSASGYPDLELDTTKCDPESEPAGSSINATHRGIRRMHVCQPQGIAEVIYRFDSRVDSTRFEGNPLGIRYIGPTYSTIMFGIPLYFVKQDQATEAIRKGMTDLGHRF
jgi:hypothetical protein